MIQVADELVLHFIFVFNMAVNARKTLFALEKQSKPETVCPIFWPGDQVPDWEEIHRRGDTLS
jgi:hypothetical protein